MKRLSLIQSQRWDCVVGERISLLDASYIPNIWEICLRAVSVDRSVFPTGREFIKGGRPWGEGAGRGGEYQESAGEQLWIHKLDNYCTRAQRSDRLSNQLCTLRMRKCFFGLFCSEYMCWALNPFQINYSLRSFGQRKLMNVLGGCFCNIGWSPRLWLQWNSLTF